MPETLLAPWATCGGPADNAWIARVDGAMVPLNTPLQNGQTVEITLPVTDTSLSHYEDAVDGEGSTGS